MGIPSRVDLEPAYILHGRSYRETSQILELFTSRYGRVGVVARGARRPKSVLRGILNPFQALRVSWAGRGDLATLTHAEPASNDVSPVGEAVLAGFYVNELLLKLLERRDPHPDLFLHYGQLVSDLRSQKQLEVTLRSFELYLLEEIGYGLNLLVDANSHESLLPDELYEFQPETGAVLSGDQAGAHVYPGRVLQAIGSHDFDDRECLKAAKRLLRSVLNFHLGGRPLETRKVAAAMKRQA